MEDNFKKINLSSQTADLKMRRKKKGIKGHIFKLVVVALILLLAGVIGWSFLSSGSYVFQYVMSSGPKFKTVDNRVNILLLGNAGGTHDGPQLTDSIIVASYHLESHKVTLFSVPRDLWVETVKGKVNSVYERGEERPEGGLQFAKEEIGKLVGIPIQYGVRIDFNGFAKAVDLIEGIAVEVPKSFDDYNYPIEGKEDDLCGLVEKEVELSEEEAGFYKLKTGKQKVLVDTNNKIATTSADFACRFEHIHFNKGKVQMNGETALKFVRSRMGTNGEGSDFARSRRQQLVIQAFRSKALSLETLINPGKIVGLVDTFGESIETDINKEIYLDFYNLAKSADKVNSVVLGDLGEGKSAFEVGEVGKYGAFVLVPPNADFSSVHELVKRRLDEDAIVVEEIKQGEPVKK